MSFTSFDVRRQVEGLDRAALERLQLEKLNRLLADVRGENAFYQRSWRVARRVWRASSNCGNCR